MSEGRLHVPQLTYARGLCTGRHQWPISQSTTHTHLTPRDRFVQVSGTAQFGQFESDFENSIWGDRSYTFVPVTYRMQKTGACAAGLDFITDDAGCNAAAVQLKLTDSFASIVESTDDPFGCYWVKSQARLLLNPAGNKMHNDTVGDKLSICKGQGSHTSTSIVPIW